MPNLVCVSLPILPDVLLLLSTPKAMVGSMQAKYRKNMVDIVFCIVFRPIKPARHEREHEI